MADILYERIRSYERSFSYKYLKLLLEMSVLSKYKNILENSVLGEYKKSF